MGIAVPAGAPPVGAAPAPVVASPVVASSGLAGCAWRSRSCRSSLSDGYVDSRDIEALRNQKGVGEWSVEQLQQLCDTGACSYLMALRARRRQ